MSQLTLIAIASPGAQATNKGALYYDSTLNRLIWIDEKGMKSHLPSAGLDNWNYLTNGGFRFARRQVAANATTYAATTGRSYAADRFGMTIQTSSLEYTRIDSSAAPETGLQARHYGKFKQLTGAGKFIVSQVIEGNNALHMRGNQVRVQVLMKASTTKTIRLGLLQLNSSGTLDTIPAAFESAFGADATDPTWGTNLALISPDFVSVKVFGATPGTMVLGNSGVSCTVTTTWQGFGAVFTCPSNFRNLIPVIWTDAQFAINDILNVSQFGFYDKRSDIDWEEQEMQVELLDCQRYYQKSFLVDTAPASNAGALTGEIRIPSPVGASTAFGIAWTIEFALPMRTAPTITLFNPAAAGAQVRNQTLNTDCTSTSTSGLGDQRFAIGATTPASTVAGTNILGVHYTADAEL